MSTRPFAYNPSGNILGTQQFGSLTVGTPANGFELQSVKFWNGPDENLGYIIAQPDPYGLRTGADNEVAYLGFVRSSVKTEASFLELVSLLFNQSFLDGDAAKIWLNDNGYWTSWGLTIANTNGQWLFYSDEGQLDALAPVTDGNAIFIIRDNQDMTMTETFDPNKSSGTNEIYFNLSDSTGTDYTTQFTALQTNGGTISITQGANTVTYTSTTPGAFFVQSQEGFFIIQTGPATQTMTSASPFVYGDPISITFS